MKTVLKRAIALIMCIAIGCSCAMMAFATDTETASAEVVLSPQQEKENVANEKYNILLQTWSTDPNNYNDENCVFPSFYGGSYIDENKNFVILVTTYDEATIAYFAALFDLTDVRFEEVEFSLNEVLAAKEQAVDTVLSDSELYSDIIGLGVSQQENSVTVEVYAPDNDVAALSENNTSLNTLIDFPNVIITYSDTQAEACATVSPGTGISNRSVGFWATDASGNLGIVTAPHASISAGATLTYNGSTFGTAQTPYFSGSVDAVFVKRTNSNMSPTRVVPDWGCTISGSASLSVGTSIYARGKTSGAIAGTIVDNYYTSVYSGVSISCVNTNASAAAGDSGGPVVGGGSSSSRYLLGIVISTTGSGKMNYCKSTNLLSKLNVKIY